MTTQEVEQYILNEIETKHGIIFRLRIESLPIAKKRVAMLAAICYKKDDGLKKMIREIESMDRIAQLDKLIERIRKYNPVGEIEKDSFGEIFTPFSLINDMLDTLPIEVWSNPNLKWGDFCNGVGNFMIIVIKRLMVGLETWQPDEDKRYDHIVKNMIYVAELQIKNMFLWMVSIDPRSEYKLNLYRGSSLEKDFDEHMKNVWKVEKMDIMVGNPPYQTGTKGGNGQRDLWPKFVNKYLNILKDDGYLLYVHPSKWRKPNSEIFNEFKKKNLIYLEIHSDKDGQKIFKANTRYDWYLLQNCKYSGITTIVDETGNRHRIDITEWSFIPNYNFELVKNIVALKNEEKLNVIYSSSIYEPRKPYMSKDKDEKFIFPCIYGMYQNLTCSYYYSSENKGHIGIQKVILGIGRHLYPLIDIDGIYGMTQNSFAIKVETYEDAVNIKNAITSDKFKEIVKSTKWGNFQTDYNMFKSFRKDFWKEFID